MTFHQLHIPISTKSGFVDSGFVKPSDEHVYNSGIPQTFKVLYFRSKRWNIHSKPKIFFVNSKDSEFVKLGFEILPQKFKSLILVFSVSGQKGGTFGTSQKSAIGRLVPITQNQ